MPTPTAAKKRIATRTGGHRRVSISKAKHKEHDELYAALRDGEAKLVAPSGKGRMLPESLDSFLVELTRLFRETKYVAIVQDQAIFTTAEAAGLLGVSRQFLVNLLEGGEIPFHLVGAHRRIGAEDLFQYKAQRAERRHKVIRELARAEAKEGIYGRELVRR